MRLIAKKPCSFGGQQFYIGDEVPENLVADVKLQEKYGVITIVNEGIGVSGGQSGALFTQEQVEAMIAEAVETEPGAYEGTIQIAVKGTADGQYTAVPAIPEEIQQVFSIMQLNAEDGARAIADVRSENVLILLHAADSRKTVKNAAKEQVDKLFSTEGVSNESSKVNETTGPDTEGVDA